MTVRIFALIIICFTVLAGPYAPPADGQQGLSQHRSSSDSSSARSPTALELELTKRLQQQVQDARPESTDTRQPARPRVSASPHAASTTQSEITPLIQRAHFEVGEEPTTPNSSEESTAPSAGSSAPPFLELTLDKDADASSVKNRVANPLHAEVTLASSPVEVLTRAVAWIVIALCLGSLTVLALRRWQRFRGLLPTTNAKCKVLETLSLGPGRTVSLIEMAGFRALVASDAGGIRSLVLAPSSFQEELMVVSQEMPSD